ncbi:hypothetical protein ACF0H5_012507 [Mactra antiquata]
MTSRELYFLNKPNECSKPNCQAQQFTDWVEVPLPEAKHTPCDYDINQCKSGTCRQTELLNGRNFLCACPSKKTGTFCELTAPDCLECEDMITCSGFDDGTTFCICNQYKQKTKNKDYQTPSICYFPHKKDPGKQGKCKKGKHHCTPGEECIVYNDVICQCPVGNTRGNNCEEDFKFDIPGNKYSCVDTMYGPLCMCNKYGNKLGFCKGKIMIETLVGALNDTGPCSIDRNKCRHGTCIQTGEDNFMCTCHISYSGKFCHIAMPLCDDCKEDKRSDCLGLSTGTAICICHGFKDNLYTAPAICYFKPFLRSRQKACNRGDHNCQRGEHCINYSHKGPQMQVCLCTAGISRGKKCLEDYRYIGIKDVDKFECVNTENRGPLCLCSEYHGKLGFCKLSQGANSKYMNGNSVNKNNGIRTKGGRTTDKYGFVIFNSEDQSISSISGETNRPCEQNRCHNGTCMETEKHKKWEYICSCPKGKTGELCHYDMLLCELCRKKKIVDCIGIEGNSAVCICLMMKNPRKHGLQPQICYTEHFRPKRQLICKRGDYKCSPRQQCVNYARRPDQMFTLCQCPAGGLRGDDCKEEYALADAGETSCVDTGKGPICICHRYPGYIHRFCKPKLKETHVSSKQKRSLPKINGLLKVQEGSCDRNVRKCKTGQCIEPKKGLPYVCSCPFKSSGVFCNEDMISCKKCREGAKLDCLGFSNGTAVCICVEFEDDNLSQVPAICYYDQFRKYLQTVCKQGHHNCDQGQDCINYALTHSDNQITCQCPVGKKRGKNCNDEYAYDTPNGEFSCINTDVYGTLCICEKYGHGINKYGFCKLMP